jgi:hypothetical protein
MLRLCEKKGMHRNPVQPAALLRTHPPNKASHADQVGAAMTAASRPGDASRCALPCPPIHRLTQTQLEYKEAGLSIGTCVRLHTEQVINKEFASMHRVVLRSDNWVGLPLARRYADLICWLPSIAEVHPEVHPYGGLPPRGGVLPDLRLQVPGHDGGRPRGGRGP